MSFFLRHMAFRPLTHGYIKNVLLSSRAENRYSINYQGKT